MNTGFLGPAVATVLTVYGIETIDCNRSSNYNIFVATVLTVYGIETPSNLALSSLDILRCNSTYRLRY